MRRGKGGRRREVGMDDWACEQLEPWLTARVEPPIGPPVCVVNGPNDPWTAMACLGGTLGPAERGAPGRRSAAVCAAPAAHAHAVEMAREGMPLIVIQRQLGHTNRGITSIYLQGIATPRSSTPCTHAVPR